VIRIAEEKNPSFLLFSLSLSLLPSSSSSASRVRKKARKQSEEFATFSFFFSLFIQHFFVWLSAVRKGAPKKIPPPRTLLWNKYIGNKTSNASRRKIAPLIVTRTKERERERERSFSSSSSSLFCACRLIETLVVEEETFTRAKRWVRAFHRRRRTASRRTKRRR